MCPEPAPVPGLVPVADHDLATGSEVPAPNQSGEISLLVRVHGIPTGLIHHLPVEGGAEARQQAVWAAVGAEVEAHLRADGWAGDVSPASIESTRAQCAESVGSIAGLVTVVVCTIGRDPRLPLAIESLLAQTYEPLELVVVDNDPASGRVPELLEALDDVRLRIVPEHRRGLSWARNAGLTTATGRVVAFTDDDAVADPDWVRHLVAPFGQDPRVRCTTGLVLPAELSTPSQLLFEQYGAFDKGFQRTVWQLGSESSTVRSAVDGPHDGLFPFSPGIFGSGNNMAYDRRWLLEHGGFDTILGAGAPVRSGEDVDAFLTVLLSHQLLVYVPQAVIRHFARSDMAGLRTQVYGYGIGMAGTITKHLLGDPTVGRQVLVRLPAGLLRLFDPRSGKNVAKQHDYPRMLTLTEYAGYLAGPATYLAARWKRRVQRR